MGKKFKSLFKFLFCLFLIFSWLFSGWPPVWHNPPIPPRIKEAQAGTVATPTFGTNGGSSNNDMSTTISTSTGGASICYTTDGTTPTGANNGTCTHGTLVASGSTVNVTVTGTVVKAIGVKGPSQNDSAIATSNAFTLTVANPSFGTNGGSYNNDTSSTQTSATTGAVFCYTVDGVTTPAASTPGTCSVGSTGATATVTATGKTIKVLGTKVGYVNSSVQTSNAFTLTVANPSFGTNGGSYNNDTPSTQTSTTTGAVFCYTLDGATPGATTAGTCDSDGHTQTGATATVIATGTTIKVLGTKANYVNSSVQTSSAFTLTVGAITSAPGAGSYTSAQNVTLSIATTTGATAHYTTDGTAVSCSSTTYSGAFNVSTTTTVKAIGCKTNYISDAAISDLYTIAVYSVTITTDKSIAYGTIEVPGSKSTLQLVPADTQTAQNDGNVTEKLSIKTSNATGGTGWTIGSEAGSNVFVHEFSVNGGSNWTPFTAAENYQTLVASLGVGSTQNFDLRITVPTSTDAVSKTITVTILAEQL